MKEEKTFKEKFDKAADTAYKTMVTSAQIVGGVTLVGVTLLATGALDALDTVLKGGKK